MITECNWISKYHMQTCQVTKIKKEGDYLLHVILSICWDINVFHHAAWKRVASAWTFSDYLILTAFYMSFSLTFPNNVKWFSGWFLVKLCRARYITILCLNFHFSFKSTKIFEVLMKFLWFLSRYCYISWFFQIFQIGCPITIMMHINANEGTYNKLST